MIPMKVGQLTTSYVRTVLQANGCGPRGDAGILEIKTARFVELTSNNLEKHRIFYESPDDGEIDMGQVTIWEEDGLLKADY